ncbi:MAG TPA: helical backbone metal receptor [Kofleriaceae bacterium]|jgi:ABC-type Fe3+-hydroxamate transport system substrate-binding protein
MLKLTDDLGRQLIFGAPPQRIVSLVPSDTYSVIALGAVERLVGRTTYCVSPEAASVPTVGGTKDVDVDAVIALSPQLVIANQEENTRATLEALAAARVPVLVSLPRRVEQGVAHLARLARILGATDLPRAKDLVRRGYALSAQRATARTAFIPIWMDPLMTLNADTFGSDVLAQIGIANTFGDRLRLYPLAADLGKSAPQDAGQRDVRYPRVSLAEVSARGADLIILPDEPHAFSAEDEAVLRGALPDAKVFRVDGKDLFWYGAWSIEALDRLATQLA